MKRSFKLAGAAGLLALALVPTSANASHCNGLVILSGTGALANAGAVGCLDSSVHGDTNYFTPGATAARVRLIGPLPTGDGSFTIDGVTQTFKWQLNAGGFFESPVLSFAPGFGGTVTAATPSNQGALTSVYQRL